MRLLDHRTGAHTAARGACFCVLALLLLVCGHGCIGYFMEAGNYAYADGTWTGTLSEINGDSVAIDPGDKTGDNVLVLEVASHPRYEWRHYGTDEIQQDAPPVAWKVVPRRLLLVDDATGKALGEQDNLPVGHAVRVVGNYNSKRFNSDSGDDVTSVGHPDLDGVLYVRTITPVDAGDAGTL